MVETGLSLKRQAAANFRAKAAKATTRGEKAGSSSLLECAKPPGASEGKEVEEFDDSVSSPSAFLTAFSDTDLDSDSDTSLEDGRPSRRLRQGGTLAVPHSADRSTRSAARSHDF